MKYSLEDEYRVGCLDFLTSWLVGYAIIEINKWRLILLSQLGYNCDLDICST